MKIQPDILIVTRDENERYVARTQDVVNWHLVVADNAMKRDIRRGFMATGHFYVSHLTYRTRCHLALDQREVGGIYDMGSIRTYKFEPSRERGGAWNRLVDFLCFDCIEAVLT